MSVEATVFDSHSAVSEEQISENHAIRKALLHASLWEGEHDAFKQHMENTPVSKDCDGWLKCGIEVVLGKMRTLSEVAPTLIILL